MQIAQMVSTCRPMALYRITYPNRSRNHIHVDHSDKAATAAQTTGHRSLCPVVFHLEAVSAVCAALIARAKPDH